MLHIDCNKLVSSAGRPAGQDEERERERKARQGKARGEGKGRRDLLVCDLIGRKLPMPWPSRIINMMKERSLREGKCLQFTDGRDCRKPKSEKQTRSGTETETETEIS